MPEYSIVIPVFNEEESLGELIKEIFGAMDGVDGDYEIILVNDGSNDRSVDIINDLTQQHPKKIVSITLSDRMGQTYALNKGIKSAKGAITTTLDADLQNDPADIPKLIQKMNETDLDCVCGWRRARQDKFLKARLSKFGNVLQRLFSGLTIHDVSCTLRAYKDTCVNSIPLNWEGQHRFIPLSLSLQGYQIGEIESHHRKRKYGTTKYSHKRIFKVVIDFFKVLLAKGRK